MHRYNELEQLITQFRRNLPQDQCYSDRLAEELELIRDQNFARHFLRVREILDLTTDIPHITRG